MLKMIIEINNFSISHIWYVTMIGMYKPTQMYNYKEETLPCITVILD